MGPSLLFISNSLHDTCIARLQGRLPTIPASLDNPFLTPHEGDKGASYVEAEVTENGILLASDTPIDYEDFIKYLKSLGIGVENIGVNICG
jgi:hypothetical protein